MCGWVVGGWGAGEDQMDQVLTPSVAFAWRGVLRTHVSPKAKPLASEPWTLNPETWALNPSR